MPIQRHLLAYSTPTVAVTAYNRELDRKEYELKDHLGNIHTTVKDYKVPIVTTSASNDVVFQEKFDAGTASGFVAATLPAGTIVDNIGNALRVYGSATGAAAQKTIPLTIASPGQYVLSFDYNAGTCSDAQFVISNLTPSIGSTLGNIQLSGRYDFVLNVPSSITTLDLSFVYQDASAGKSFYIDNILIKKIDEPNALPLSVIADENFSTPSNWIGTNTIIDYSAGTLNIKKDPAYISSSFFATKSVNLLQDQLYKITFSVTALAMGTSSLSLAFENDENTSGFDYNTPLSNSAIITYTYYVVPKTNLVNMVFNIKNTSGTFSCDIDNFKIQHVVSPLQPMYIAVMNNLTDYYAFGMPTPGRKAVASTDYQYGFNGKRKENEIAGNGNDYDFGARIYDSRLGRFLSIDPFIDKFPALSSFAFAANSPIMAIDKEGKYIFIVTKGDQIGSKPIIKKATAEDLKYIPGFEGLYKTKSGRRLIEKYLNSNKKDLFLTVKDIKGTRVGGDTRGQAIDPDYTESLTNKNCEFDASSKIDEMRKSGGAPPGLYEINKNFRNFNNVPLRDEATENAFIVIDPQIGISESEKVKTAGHEMLHINEYEKGNKSEHHGEKSFEEGLEKIEIEYHDVEKKENEPKK